MSGFDFGFVTVILLTATSSAFADVVDIKWSSQGNFSHRGTIAAGKFVEVCGKLSGGQKIRWDFETSTAVDFNVHFHEGKEVIFPAKLTAVSRASDVLDAKVTQDYCWMWSNQAAAPASFSVNLRQ